MGGAPTFTSNEAMTEVASISSVVTAEPLAGVLSWLGHELRDAFDDSAAEALAVCVEVILLDQETPSSEALGQAAGILADEGAPGDLIESLCSRWQAACESAKGTA